jgi:hypothetical protein
MDITSKINLENGVFVRLELEEGRLSYELEYDEDHYLGNLTTREPYNKFYVYEKNDTGIKRYRGIKYKKINTQGYLEKPKPLQEGFYLFVFNKTKLFVELSNNRISYELEDVGIETDEVIDIS